MRNLSKIEIIRRSELNPKLQQVCDLARYKLNQKGLDFFYVCGWRGPVAQAEAVKKKLSKVSFPNSKHNKSIDPSAKSDAVDLAVFKNGKIDWEDTKGFYEIYFTMQEAAAELGIKIRSGADFDQDKNLKNDKWIDLPHHEIV